MLILIRFLTLVLILNVIRYVIGGLIEAIVIMPPLFHVMQENASYFNTEFDTIDWVTSYVYNFVMWAVATWIYHISRPVLSGPEIVRSLKIFGLAFLFFAAVSFIYMNHYSHAASFYFINVADALIVFTLVGVANGWLYPMLMPEKGTIEHDEG